MRIYVRIFLCVYTFIYMNHMCRFFFFFTCVDLIEFSNRKIANSF